VQRIDALDLEVQHRLGVRVGRFVQEDREVSLVADGGDTCIRNLELDFEPQNVDVPIGGTLAICDL
jgi:hypothetical protein